MWCTTSTSTCSSGPVANSARPDRQLGRPGRTTWPRRPAHRGRQARRADSATSRSRRARSASRIRWYGSPSDGREHGAQRLVPGDHVAAARPPARRRPASPATAAPSACCRSRSGLPAGPGTTAGAGRTTAGSRVRPLAGRERPAQRRSAARPRRAGRRGRRRSVPRTAPADGSSTPSTARIREISRMASSEWPPRSKKLSSTPTGRAPSTSANSARTGAPPRRSRGRRPAGASTRIGAGQRPAVELAVGGQRQLVAGPRRGRHHVRPASLARRGGAARRRRRHRRPAPRRPTSRVAVLGTTTAAWRDRRDVGQHGLDLARLDPEPADLHLVVGPAQEHQLAVARSTAPGRRCGTSARPAGPNGSATNRSAVSPGRPRYPRPTCAPATYSSPGTPTGTGRSALIQHVRPGARHRPADHRPVTAHPGDQACTTVHSVGP